MSEFFALYFGLGLVAAIITFRCARRSKVSSTFIEGLAHSFFSPGIFLLTVIFWPIFFLNDIFLVIPRERKERLVKLKMEINEARMRRALARERRLADHSDSVVGHTGYTITPLRLAGEVRIDDMTWSAISESGFIPSGARVEVTAQRKREITVRISSHEEANKNR